MFAIVKQDRDYRLLGLTSYAAIFWILFVGKDGAFRIARKAMKKEGTWATVGAGIKTGVEAGAGSGTGAGPGLALRVA